MTFTGPVDIGNRALQHCGVKMMGSLGFAERSDRALEVSFVYDKLRRDELRRNTWRFATKRVALRPLALTTMLLSPAVWVSTVTYFNGSIVADQSGLLWRSTAPNNLGNNPLTSPVWEQYCGPLTVNLYDSTTSYFAGELVYTMVGDGKNRVFMSLLTGNSDDPLVPTVWSSSATYYQNQTVTYYPTWASGTTYAVGKVVNYNGTIYVSLVGSNLGNTPGVGAQWLALSLTSTNALQVSEWSIATAYTVNTVVAYNGSLYLATANSTGLVPPSNAGSWTALSGGVAYQSLVDLNVNNEPDLSPAAWASGTTYSSGQQVYGTDGQIYTSSANSNLGNNPVTDGGVHWTATGTLAPWTTSFVGGAGSLQWLEIGGNEFQNGVALTRYVPLYPLGSGPLEQSATKNAFRLPANFLRQAPDDPKAGQTAWLGAPTGLTPRDWNFEGNFIVSQQPDPIILRFVTDFIDVTNMDDMFCEALAAKVAMAVAPRLVQSGEKLKNIAGLYNVAVQAAITVNGIETGPTEPPVDSLITARY